MHEPFLNKVAGLQSETFFKKAPVQVFSCKAPFFKTCLRAGQIYFYTPNFSGVKTKWARKIKLNVHV